MAYQGMQYFGGAYSPGWDTQMRAHPTVAARHAKRMYDESADGEQQIFERGLQQQEQNRRMFDSQTQRQKFGLLNNLLGGR